MVPSPLASFAPPFPSSCYLLQKALRFRYRAASGAPDLNAARLAAAILPTAEGLDPGERARLGRVLDRIEKGAVAFGDAGPDGMLDERFGFPIMLEVPIGGVRRGVGDDGEPWEQTMVGAGYGFIPDTVARDDEPIDVIVGPDATATSAYLLTQLRPDGGAPAALDEYKLGVGFPSLDAFERTYCENWPPDGYGGITVVPVEVLRGLLGFELEDAGIVKKSLRAFLDTGGVFAITKAGAVLGRVASVAKEVWSRAYINDLPDTAFLFVEGGGEKDAEGKTAPRELRHFPVRDKDGAIDPEHVRAALSRIPQFDVPPAAKEEARTKAERMLDEIGRTEKGVTGLDAFAGGGLVLPGQGRPRPRRTDLLSKIVEPMLAALRCAEKSGKALDSATSWQGAATPIGDRPELADHPATTESLSWTYDAPLDVGGWIGAIEPADESWIAFVDASGRTLLWTSREENGAIVGTPVEIQRPDLARPDIAESMKATHHYKAVCRLLPVQKALTVTDRERRIVYGVVLEPEPFDGRGDAHDETYSAEVIERAAHDFMAMGCNLDDKHGRFFRRDEVVAVESYVAPQDLVVDGSAIKQGSWVLAARIVSDEVWGRVLRGELSAWSIEGYAERVPNIAA